jgi:hypothetical protein
MDMAALQTARSPQGRSAWLRRGIALMVLALVTGGAYWVGSTTVNAPVPNAGLVAAGAGLNFGEVWEHPEFKWTLPLENPTPGAVEVTGFNVSCACLRVEPKSLLLSPGQKKNVELTVDLRFGRNKSMLRDFSVQLVPEIKDASLRQEGWTIWGKVRKAFDVVPEQVRFDEGALIRGETFPSKRVRVDAHIELVDLNSSPAKQQ